MPTRGNVARWLTALVLTGAVAGCSGGSHHSSAQAPATSTTTTTTTSSAAATATSSPSTTLPATGPVGGPVPAGFQPASVTFTSAEDGWVLGDAPCGHPVCTSLVRTVDAGRTWQGVPAPPAPFDASPGRLGGATGVFGVRFADPRDGWAYGSQVWATHDAGATWHRVSLPGLGAGTQVLDLEAASGSVFAIVGGTSGGALALDRSAAASDGWSTAANVGSAAPSSATPRLVLAGGRGWLVYGAAQGGGPAWLTTADLASGRGWPPGHGPCTGPDGGGVMAVAPSGVVDVVCAGPAGAGQQQKPVFQAADGTTFTPVQPAPEGGDLEAAAAPSARSLVVAAASGASELYLTADAGRTWTTALQQATGGIPFEELGFTTPAQGVAILGVPTTAGAPAAGIPPSSLLITRDGGRTWSGVTFGA